MYKRNISIKAIFSNWLPCLSTQCWCLLAFIVIFLPVDSLRPLEVLWMQETGWWLFMINQYVVHVLFTIVWWFFTEEKLCHVSNSVAFVLHQPVDFIYCLAFNKTWWNGSWHLTPSIHSLTHPSCGSSPWPPGVTDLQVMMMKETHLSMHCFNCTRQDYRHGEYIL